MEGESGFVLTHVLIASRGGKLVKLIHQFYNSITTKNEANHKESARILKEINELVNEGVNELKEMYHRNDVNQYFKFRSFFGGCKNSCIFPEGVIFEGVSKEP